MQNFDPYYISKEFTKDKKHTLVVFDDLTQTLLKSPVLGLCWSVLGHHRNLSCINIQQNAYPPGLISSTTLARNSDYKIIFKNNSDILQTLLLGRSMFPGQSKYWKEVVDSCLKKPHDYIFLDLHKTTPDCLRVRNSCFPEIGVACYVPTEKKVAEEI